jgi:cyclic beta-1,2-glucan synthetase
VRIPRGETVRLSFWTMIAGSRQEALDVADKHREPTAFDRVSTMAWTQAQGHFHHLGSGPEEAHLFQRIANRVIYSDPALRPPSDTLKRGGRNLSALWAHGISGDLPIVPRAICLSSSYGSIRSTTSIWCASCFARLNIGG